jgi:hypothetical protein
MKEMEALFDELSADDGDYGYSVKWKTSYIIDEKNWVYVVDPAKDTFEIHEFSFSWYHAGNLKHPNTPVVIAQWTTNHKEDDWDENEQEVDATAEDIASFIRNRNGALNDDRYFPDRLEEIG